MQDSSPDSPTPGSGSVPAAGPAAPAQQPRPKSAYELPSRKNTVLRNMIWALSLTVAVVVVVGIAFFGVGSDLERTPLPNSQVDVAQSAQRAEEIAPFPVAVPQMGEEWSEQSARFTDGEQPRWSIRYSSPQGSLVTLVQEAEIGAPLLSSALPGATVSEELTIEGADCQVLTGSGEGAGRTGITCQAEDTGLLVHGEAPREELEELATAALTSIR